MSWSFIGTPFDGHIKALMALCVATITGEAHTPYRGLPLISENAKPNGDLHDTSFLSLWELGPRSAAGIPKSRKVGTCFRWSVLVQRDE